MAKALWLQLPSYQQVTKPPKRRKRIKGRSIKMEAMLRLYRVLRKTFLMEHRQCAVCRTRTSTDVHHKRGRGRYLNDIHSWLAVCRPCHHQIENNPQWALDNGYRERRT